jgi:hypothetical protein
MVFYYYFWTMIAACLFLSLIALSWWALDKPLIKKAYGKDK